MTEEWKFSDMFLSDEVKAKTYSSGEDTSMFRDGL